MGGIHGVVFPTLVWMSQPHLHADIPSLFLLCLAGFPNTSHMPQAASQPTCLRKTALLFPATPLPLRMITCCRETSAITVWKTDACQVSHATSFPCHVISRHEPCWWCHGSSPALHLLGQAPGYGWCRGMIWYKRCSPCTRPTTPPEIRYQKDNNPCSWHGRILFP